MPRTTLTKTTALGPYGDYTIANAADLTMTAADAVNYNQFVFGGEDLVIAHNTGGSIRTITITAASDPYRRAGNVIYEYSLGIGEYAVFGPFKAAGWLQSDGYLYLQASHADVKFGVVKLPG